MIRGYEASDRRTVTEMLDEFYHSSAVLHPIPRAHFEKTLNAAEAGNPCVRLYVIESGGRPAGYALLALTFSNEAGGDVVWLDEIYIRPEFQGKGLPLPRGFVLKLRPTMKAPFGSTNDAVFGR